MQNQKPKTKQMHHKFLGRSDAKDFEKVHVVSVNVIPDL